MKNKTKALITLSVLSGIVLLIYFGVDKWGRKPGPHDFIMDKHVCHFCKMHVGDIRFAGQIQTDSQTYFYDDMGCLIKDYERMKVSVIEVYYQHYFEDRWISEDEVVFFKVEESPMGYNFGAISQNDTASIIPLDQRVSLSQAKIKVLNTSMGSMKKSEMNK